MVAYKQTKIPQAEILPQPTDIGALGNRINHNTRQEHNAIDRQMTIKFALALRDARIYRQGIQAFYHVFKTVEQLIDEELAREPRTKTGEVLAQFWRPEFARTGPMQKDLLFFYNNDPSKFETPIRDEQIAFAKHIRDAYAQKPHILLAYCHVMYLALFAGGRIMRSAVTKATGIFPQVDGKTTEEVSKLGTHFFKFNVEDEEVLRLEYKKAYELATRNALTEEEKIDIIEEAKEIFRRNGIVVSEIELHNRKKLTSKLSYKVLNYGYYVVLILAIFASFSIARRLISHLL